MQIDTKNNVGNFVGRPATTPANTDEPVKPVDPVMNLSPESRDAFSIRKRNEGLRGRFSDVLRSYASQHGEISSGIPEYLERRGDVFEKTPPQKRTYFQRHDFGLSPEAVQLEKAFDAFNVKSHWLSSGLRVFQSIVFGTPSTPTKEQAQTIEESYVIAAAFFSNGGKAALEKEMRDGKDVIAHIVKYGELPYQIKQCGKYERSVKLQNGDQVDAGFWAPRALVEKIPAQVLNVLAVYSYVKARVDDKATVDQHERLGFVKR